MTEATSPLDASPDAVLARLVERGLVEPGLARRVALVSRLTAGTAWEGTVPPAWDETRPALSGQALAAELGLSRAAVHKHVEQLRSQGFAIESVVGQGHRLAQPCTDLLAGEAVLPFILQGLDPEQPWVAGLPYQYQARCESTNRVLRDLVGRGDPPAGATVVTDHQTRGRGRLDRVWRDESGKDLTFSVLLRPSLAPGQAHLLSLAAALAVAETAEAVVGQTAAVMVKWPNDVMVAGRKLCGILLEGSMDGDRLHWAIAGIGLNVNSDCSGLAALIETEDADGAAGRPAPVSLRELAGGEVPRAPLLAALLRRLTNRWAGLEGTGGPVEVLAGLRKRDALVGRQVEIVGGGSRHEVLVAGEAAGLGPEGQLLVRTSAGEVVAVFAGDVTVKKAAP
jgi:BirA family biotin operon repressor/biotin-[acetyl-CoA-carboxylase] ligase